VRCVKFNSPLPRQTAGQNQAKLLEMFIYISKIVPQNAQANESNLRKFCLVAILGINLIAYTNAFSSSEMI